MKKFVILVCFTVFFTSCSGNISQAYSSVIENRAQNAPAEQPIASSVPDVQYLTVASSPDGLYSVCRSETDGYLSGYCILDSQTGQTVSLGEFFSSADIKFISDDSFSLTENDYLVFDTDGNMLYRLSDHFPLGILEDGRDIRLYSVYHRKDGGLLVLYYDGNERIPPEAEFNTGSANQPYLYRICAVSADGKIEKTINTGKHVETNKHYGVSVYMEETDENSVVLYSEYCSGDTLARGFEIHVNLLNGECRISDLRPPYNSQQN